MTRISFDVEEALSQLRPFLRRAAQGPEGASITLAFDSGGSVSGAEWGVRRHFVEMVRYEIRNTGRPVRIVYFDTMVRTDMTVGPEGNVPLAVHGGGTVLDPMLAHIATHPAGMLVVVSDMVVSPPTVFPGCPTFWVNEAPSSAIDLLAHFAPETLEALSATSGRLAESDLADLLDARDARIRLWAQSAGAGEVQSGGGARLSRVKAARSGR